MPTYDYECRSCKHEFEAFQSILDDSLTECPQCREHSLRRLIGGGTGIIFKGSGFYVNDSRGASDSKAKKPDAPSSQKKTDSNKGKASA